MLGSVGLWRERIYLVGGLAPRYIVGEVPEDAEPHVGTTDVDLVIGYQPVRSRIESATFRNATAASDSGAVTMTGNPV